MTPSAGQYNPKDDFIKKSQGVISFGPRPPKPPKNGAKKDGPGPGSYTLSSTLCSSNGVFIGGGSNAHEFHGQPNSASELKGRNISPGPGAYDDKSRSLGSSTRGVILLGRHKDHSIKNDTPGPGTYQVKPKYFENDSQKISFGLGDRFQNHTSPLDNKAKGAKMGGKADNSIPGPGTYTVKDSPQGPQFSIGGVKENDQLFKGRHKSPGPGSYSIKDELEYRIQGGRFSSSKRPERRVSTDPGPGHYDQNNDDLKHAPEITIKGRYPYKKPDLLPGPGQYKQDSELLKNSPAFTMKGKY